MRISFTTSIQTRFVGIAQACADVNHCDLHTQEHDLWPGMTYIKFTGARSGDAEALMLRQIDSRMSTLNEPVEAGT